KIISDFDIKQIYLSGLTSLYNKGRITYADYNNKAQQLNIPLHRIENSLFINQTLILHTNLNSINTHDWDTIEGVVIDQEELVGTSIKYLVSFDNKQTWKYFNGKFWATTLIQNIDRDGMSESLLESLTEANFSAPLGFSNNVDTLDFAIGFKIQDEAKNPLLNQIDVNYAIFNRLEDNPSIINTRTVPYSSIRFFGETLGQNNEGTITYQLSNNGSSFYYFNGENWVSAQGYENSNGADVVNEHISQFAQDVGVGDFYFKAFLHSEEGLQKVELDSVSIFFEFNPEPQISTINPTVATNNDLSLPITINGSNFTEGAQVKLTKLNNEDIICSNVNVLSSEEITCNFNLNLKDGGLWNVIVTNNDTRFVTLSNAFSITDMSPTISSVTPSIGNNNTQKKDVIITGTNFKEGLTVRLTKPGYDPINAFDIAPNSENEVACSFDLRGKQAGDWDLVITNPNTQFRRLERGFKVEAAINRLSVVTKEQTIRPDLPSSIIIIQAQDYNGNPAKTLEPINISLNSNGEFSLEKESWTFVDSLIIKSGEHEAGIYYKNSEEESDTLSFSNEIFGQISQSINIDENAPKTWRFDNLNEYIYDNSKIEVSNSLAKLKDIGREGDFYAINFDLENKNNFIQEDVKGFITRWEYDSGSLGHFDYPINDKIKAGTILDINGKLYTILKIDGDGTHARAVELDEFVPTGEISHIYGINFKNTDIALGGGGYTRLISFSKATPYNDYLLRVELDVSFDYTKTQVNGEDLRFFVNETELDYYIDTWNENSYSLILVKIPEEGTLSINMAYGNEDVLPKSNPEIISNLLAGYDFDDSNEIGKDIFDLRDGVNTSSTLLTTGCVSKSCLNLNGSAYITVPNFNIGNSSFVSFWAKSSSYGGTMPFSFNGDNYSSGPDLYFTGSAAYWNTGDGSTNKFSGSSYPDSKWHHFTVINDEKTNAKLYIDGILKGTAIFKNNKTETNNTFFIGRYDSGGYNFVGQIDKFKIYNNLIPETNIEDDYYSGLKQLLNNGTITQTEFNQRASTLNYDIVATASQETNVTIPVSSYYSTTLGQFNVSDFTHVLGVEITQNVPENTSTKFLVSFDQRQTWRYWNETKWVESSLKNIEANGMNKNLVESLTQDIWESDFGFNKEKTQAIDFAVSLRTTNTSYSPSLNRITINYKKEGYDEANPFIQNNQGLPYSELLTFT
ncbi:MAG: LamG domain-containing protein, partial [Bacilli bacterium]